MPVELSVKVTHPERFLGMRAHVRPMREAMQHRAFVYTSDFDGTWVATDEVNRRFPALEDDPAMVLAPVTAMLRLNLPVGVLTGNTPEYIDRQCVHGLRSALLKQGALSAMAQLAVYSQNATLWQPFNLFGNAMEDRARTYADRFRLPDEVIDSAFNVYRQVVGHHTLGRNWMNDPPIIIRPLGGAGLEERQFGPRFQNRHAVQLAWIAIPPDIRAGIIADAVKELQATFPRMMRLRHNPGGQYSIDIDHPDAAKHVGSRHFAQIHEATFDLYTGDSVYRRMLANGQTLVGNDLPVVEDPTARVIALNRNQTEIPRHARIIPGGIGPEACRGWATWALVHWIDVQLQHGHLTDAAKTSIMTVITDSGLADTGDITATYRLH
ncbi:MAG: hypothetical protein WC901_03495 [Candidatus Margulisiibacteriota bacterium]